MRNHVLKVMSCSIDRYAFGEDKCTLRNGNNTRNDENWTSKFVENL